MKSLRKTAYLLLAFSLIVLLCGCSGQLIDQAANVLLQELQSQQYQQEQADNTVPDLWTVPPEATAPYPSPSSEPSTDEGSTAVVFGEKYSKPEEVAEYLHLYNELPPNFITKNKAKELGWDASAGNLWKIAPGMSIGGDHFGNYENKLPKAQGRKWFECDVNYDGGRRGAERVLYSNDGLIYYSDDHYNSFEQLY